MISPTAGKGGTQTTQQTAAPASTPTSSLNSLASLFASGGGYQPATGWQTAAPAVNPTRPTVAAPTSTGQTATAAPAATVSPALTDALVAELARASGYYANPTQYYQTGTGDVMADIGNGRLMGNAGQAWKNLGQPR